MKNKAMSIVAIMVLLCGCTMRNPKSLDVLPEPTPTPHAPKEKQPDRPHEEEPSKTNENLYGIAVGVKERLAIQQKIQTTNYYCGPACIQMILAYHGIQVSQDALAAQIKTSAMTGSEYADMARVLNSYLFFDADLTQVGYRVQTLQATDNNESTLATFTQRVKQNVVDGYPTMVAIELQSLYPEFARANHVVLCTGYILKENSDEIAYYYLVDPYDKVQDAQYEGLKVVTPKQLINAIVNNEEPAYIW